MAVATLAAALAPTAIKLGANLLRKDKPSEYEQKLQSMSDIYRQQSDKSLDQNRVFQEGKRQLDQADEKNRESIQNASATTGATDEARLASMENNNEAYGAALSRLFNSAEQYRSRMRSRYLNSLGQLEGAEQQRDARFQRNLSNIMKPVSAASSAFMMSQLFKGGGDIVGDTPDATTQGGPDSTNMGDFNLFGGNYA